MSGNVMVEEVEFSIQLKQAENDGTYIPETALNLLTEIWEPEI